MTSHSLTAEKRTENETSSELKHLRATGRIPAVVYGLNAASLSVHVDNKELMKVARTGRSEMFKLHVEGMTDLSVIIKDFQKKDGKWNHVDFLQISESTPLRVSVPIDYHGIASGSKIGGVVQHLVTELEIEGLPANLPSTIEVDISHLEMGDKFMASEVKLPKGITLISTGEDLLLAAVTAPRAEIEEDTETNEEATETNEEVTEA
jgi:large subunit ribosomal protein L25